MKNCEIFLLYLTGASRVNVKIYLFFSWGRHKDTSSFSWTQSSSSHETGRFHCRQWCQRRIQNWTTTLQGGARGRVRSQWQRWAFRWFDHFFFNHETLGQIPTSENCSTFLLTPQNIQKEVLFVSRKMWTGKLCSPLHFLFTQRINLGYVPSSMLNLRDTRPPLFLKTIYIERMKTPWGWSGREKY